VELSSTISRRPPNSNGEVDITCGRLALSPGCPKTATDRVADDFLIPLFDVTRRLRAYAEQLARAHGMTGEELMIIARLERQPDLSFDELASIGAVTAERLARLIGGLETRGIIERSSDPADREVHLRLTPAAEPLLRDIRDLRANLQKLATRAIDPAVLNTMAFALRGIEALFRGVDHIAFA
jgi:MarR family transcriptional regulator, transcriptional regulator for hemolysin